MRVAQLVERRSPKPQVVGSKPTAQSPAASTTSSNGWASSSCPHSRLFVSTVGPAWGWTHVDAIVTTLNALGILAGALIGVSAIKQRLDLAA